MLFKAAVALVLFTSSVLAEIIRGGLNFVAQGQFEAGQSQGFHMVQIMLYIMLPQAYRNIVPTLLSQVVTTVKDSSYSGKRGSHRADGQSTADYERSLSIQWIGHY